jgi:hypothetical protein
VQLSQAFIQVEPGINVGQDLGIEGDADRLFSRSRALSHDTQAWQISHCPS